MYNKVILLGNITRDIELRYSQGGMAIAKTAIATSHKYTHNGEKKEDVCYVDLTFFGRSAEVANQYLQKGSKILIDGRLNFEQWTSEDGTKRSKHSVIVETMKMVESKSALESKANNAHEYNQQSQPYVAPEPSYKNIQGQEISKQEFQSQRTPAEQIPVIDIDEDEIPF